MATYTLDNGKICITVDSHGAELRSLQDNKKTEYLWSGNPAYWGRISPVLFPFVGKTNGQAFRTKGREYSMTQHGLHVIWNSSCCHRPQPRCGSDWNPLRKQWKNTRMLFGGNWAIGWNATRCVCSGGSETRQTNRFPSRLAAIRPLSALCGWEKSKPSASCILTHRHLKSHRSARRGLPCPSVSGSRLQMDTSPWMRICSTTTLW